MRRRSVQQQARVGYTDPLSTQLHEESEAPLRAELFSISQLERHAAQLAAAHTIGDGRADDRLLTRLADNEAVLADAYALVSDAVTRGRQITPAAEWFIDNYHLIEEQIRMARRHLPRGYSRELPRLAAPAGGTPRVYEIALELISHSHGRVDLDVVRAFVASYQSVEPLRLGELWAIPIMLRLALIENLRRVVLGVTVGRRDRERAEVWAERLLEVSPSDPSRVVVVLAELIATNLPLTNPFVSELASRLQGHGATSVFPMSWLEQQLAERGETVERAFQLASQSQAADSVAIGNSIGSLRFLGATDWRDFVESMSVVEGSLRRDPAGVYEAMDFATRDRYRHVVEKRAKKSGLSELEVAERAVALAAAETTPRRRHVGYGLIGGGRRAGHGMRLPLYLGAIAGITVGVVALLVLGSRTAHLEPGLRIVWAILGAVCASQLAVAIVHWAATLLVQPRRLPRLDFARGIPTEHRTLVAVPTMLTSTTTIDELVDALEVRSLANRDPNLGFALVGDFRDAPSEHLDDDAGLLAHATAAIEMLNLRYPDPARGGGFFLLHRARRWNPREGAWMGWERKRGKLEDLNELLRGKPEGFSTVVGPVERLRDVAYVIVLDSDTELPRDAARELAGTLAHPLNRAELDPALGRVVDGYAILQPRVGITLESANRSRFAGLFAGECGIDPYTRAVSDVYQDVFGEGSFIGKGIYDVDVVRLALTGKLPENRILSHDLLEGAYGRSGLVSDVIVFEDFPATHAADASRRARWIRGDWQIARWLLRRVPSAAARRERNPISTLSQWKILDNLRRSLVPIALVALVVVGWLVPETTWPSLALVAATLIVPGLLAAAGALARKPVDVEWRTHLGEVGLHGGRELLRDGYALACLPYEALLSLSSILRACGRVLFTRRKLLEWRTAADALRASRTELAGTYAAMWLVPAAAAATAIVLAIERPGTLDLAAPALALWTMAPALVWWISRPLPAPEPQLSTADHRFLRGLARRTWRFFESHVGAEDNHLPPDNVQEHPPVGVAHRTSPTNIGMALLSNLAAYDLGYVAADEVIARTQRTFATMDRLPRYRGHFYNWYDTQSLAPLRPTYISTVDSGNLAGHLVVLASGLAELAEHRVVRDELFGGLADTLFVVEESGAAPATLVPIRALLELPVTTLASARDRLARLLPETGRLVAALDPAASDELAWWARALAGQVESAARELDHIAPWLAIGTPPDSIDGELRDQLDLVPTLAETARRDATLVPLLARAAEAATDDAAAAWLREVGAAVALAADRATDRLLTLRQLVAQAGELGDHDYDFLYDPARHLLAIGFNEADHRLDASFYDLLASEARLASYVAIAQGKLPQEHWFHLGRLLTTSGGHTVLLSWSGSMFEYLMPLLVMPSYPGTLLETSLQVAVARQIEYGRERGVPWGVSESGYHKTDAHLNYQYRAFGVPGLGFKRGLADDLVIAPYASVMALMVVPEASCANLRRLAADGRLGGHGFYEAIDYTPSRLPPGKTSVTVQSFMAHHQGMSLLALTYVLAGRPMQRRFISDPAMRATDLLLQERVPRTTVVHPHPAEVSAVRTVAPDAEDQLRVFTSPNTPKPEVKLLSNGRYHVTVSNAGGGYSRWGDLAVTRWQEDPTRDCWGTFCYLRDVTTGSFWSAAFQPTLRAATTYEAIFSQGRAEFRRRDEDIDTHVEIAVSSEDDVELRRITLSNAGRTTRTIELTSFAEVVLATPASDAAHKTFSNLFVQTELLENHQAIVATRRPRSASERPPWGVHLMTVHGAVVRPTSYETDRAAFVGRGRTPADPAAMHQPALSNSAGSVLDPIVAIRNTVELAPDASIQVHIVTGVADTRAGAVGLIEKYRDRHLADRVLELAWTQSQVLQRRLGATMAETQLWERLASNVIYQNPTLRAPASVIARNRLGQSGLWPYGISGDLPIVLARISSADNIALVRQLVRAHTYWRLNGLVVDLVIWNEDPSGYRQDLHEQIMEIIGAVGDAALVDHPGGLFVRRTDQISDADGVLMQTLARAIIDDRAGTLAEQLGRRVRAELPMRLPSAIVDRKRAVSAPAIVPVVRPDLTAFNGHGGFTADGREYVIVTTAASRTPVPWVNVLANPYFGTVVSDSGGAYTWCENANGYRLTPWHNDPVSDTSGEALFIRDDDDSSYWSPTPLPAPGPLPYTTRHGFGYSVFETTQAGIESEVFTYVATDAPVKFLVLKLRNRSGRSRHLSISGYFELVLGSQRPANMLHVVTEVDVKTGALFATNPYSGEFAPRVAFLECSEVVRSISGDRLEFLGRNGQLARPVAMRRGRLSGRVGAGLDPCLAMQVSVELADDQEREIVFAFGSGRDLADARSIVQRSRTTGAARVALDAVWAYWNHALGAVNVQTPDASLNFLANGWLVYQVLACRMWGRSGFYQSGGAYGFRDQLQDASALIHTEPTLVRQQLVRAASRQFTQGDVQHWWHPPLGRGVRTRISDDYLWLPYTVCRYVAAIGDTGVLDEKIEFIDGRTVNHDEDSYYDLPNRALETGSLYEHCVRAIKHGLRFGAHGLPLMGTGDWNDGMNLVGAEGRGESVWLGFFLHDVLVQFAELARARGDRTFVDECEKHAGELRLNLEQHAWDGEWYRRAYFDDGAPLGSATSPECQIDSLPQSWAILSKAGDPGRSRRGLAAVDARLVDRKLGVIKLFDPPFDHSALEPGYVKGYVPGVRENGGQYTHAAIWAVMAFAAAGDSERAWELFGLINPAHHGRDAAAIATYMVEPYVVAADVYTNPQHAGRGGWTWYTGSAGWMYRLILESLLGLRLEVDRLRIEPLLPAAWDGFDIHYRHRDTVHHIHVKNLGGGGQRVARVELDGVAQPDRMIPLRDDRREHWAVVEIGGSR